MRRTAILTRETPRAVREWHFAQGIATAPAAVRTAPRPEFGLESRVCVPIRCQGALFGYLWLIDADESLSARRRRRSPGRVRPRSVRRCAATGRPRTPARVLERRLIEALLDGVPRASASRPPAQLLSDELIVGLPSNIATFAARPLRDSEHGMDVRGAARVSLAIDQFRRTLPRAHTLSLVRADHVVLIVALRAPACSATAACPSSRPGCATSWTCAFGGDDSPRIALGYARRARHPARGATRPTSTPISRCASPSGSPRHGGLRRLAADGRLPHDRAPRAGERIGRAAARACGRCSSCTAATRCW